MPYQKLLALGLLLGLCPSGVAAELWIKSNQLGQKSCGTFKTTTYTSPTDLVVDFDTGSPMCLGGSANLPTVRTHAVTVKEGQSQGIDLSLGAAVTLPVQSVALGANGETSRSLGDSASVSVSGTNAVTFYAPRPGAIDTDPNNPNEQRPYTFNYWLRDSTPGAGPAQGRVEVTVQEAPKGLVGSCKPSTYLRCYKGYGGFYMANSTEYDGNNVRIDPLTPGMVHAWEITYPDIIAVGWAYSWGLAVRISTIPGDMTGQDGTQGTCSSFGMAEATIHVGPLTKCAVPNGTYYANIRLYDSANAPDGKYGVNFY